MPPVTRAAAGRSTRSRCRWRPTGPECSPQGMCAAGRSNVAQRPSARDRWRWRWSTVGWRRRGVPEPPSAASPDTAVSPEFAELASGERIATAAAALEHNGIRSLLADTGADARDLVGSLLADGAEVYNNTSQTLEATGVADEIERSGRYQPLRLRLYRIDREMQQREVRALAAAGKDAVDEQGRRAEHLARGQAAVAVAADPVRYRDAGLVAVECPDVQADLGGVPAQVAALVSSPAAATRSPGRIRSRRARPPAHRARSRPWLLLNQAEVSGIRSPHRLVMPVTSRRYCARGRRAGQPGW